MMKLMTSLADYNQVLFRVVSSVVVNMVDALFVSAKVGEVSATHLAVGYFSIEFLLQPVEVSYAVPVLCVFSKFLVTSTFANVDRSTLPLTEYVAVLSVIFPFVFLGTLRAIFATFACR